MSHCPHCQRPWPAEESTADTTSWVSVARFSNLAEAGYVADELRSAGLRARIHERAELDAVAESWRNTYVLQTAAEEAGPAVETIERLTAEDDESSGDEPNLSLGWRAVALILAAGGLAYAGLQTIDSHRANPAPDARGLSRALAEIGVPLEAQLPNGAKRQVWFDRAEHRIYVADDLDGDGRTDRRRAFAAAW